MFKFICLLFGHKWEYQAIYTFGKYKISLKHKKICKWCNKLKED